MIIAMEKDKVYTFGKSDKIELNVEKMEIVVNETELVNIKKPLVAIDESGDVVQSSLLRPGKYKLEVKELKPSSKELAVELIQPKVNLEEEGINRSLLQLLVKIKEIKLIQAIAKYDGSLESLIEYDKVYWSSKNHMFVPELKPAEIRHEVETIQVFAKIVELRNTIYNSRTEKNANHVVFGINNPVIWLDAPNNIKRIACGIIQYRKGLHIREFDLMIYNLHLTQNNKVKKSKEYATLMRDYGLL